MLPQYAPNDGAVEEDITGAMLAGADNGVVLGGPSYFNPADNGLFHKALAPYGTWQDMPGYGWCWQPTAYTLDPSWQPYVNNGPLGLVGLRLVLEVELLVGLGAIPLRAVVEASGSGLVVAVPAGSGGRRG